VTVPFLMRQPGIRVPALMLSLENAMAERPTRHQLAD
jgi:hypothetical protein